ncbi:MAG: cobalamin-dependent protein, partial [Proteobacteria bacterium]|nr:cobalamin-dependent protein [Pseudomonadota bacterium]
MDYVAGAISPPHQVQVIDLFGHEDNEVIERAMARFSPEVVGLSIRNIDNAEINNIQNLLSGLDQIVQTIRRAGRAKVVLGGSGFTIMPHQIMAFTGADYGVIGEGERLGLLLEALEGGRTVAGIPGIVDDTAGQEDIEPARREFHPPPWSGPIIRRPFVDPDVAKPYLEKGGMLNIQTKRGCPYACVYCTYPVVEGSVIRPFDPREIALQALRLQEAGAKYLFVVDSVFNSDRDHSLAVARSLSEAGVTIPWGAFFAPRPDS